MDYRKAWGLIDSMEKRLNFKLVVRRRGGSARGTSLTHECRRLLELYEEFERLGVIDEYEVFVMPTLLGEGIPLFPSPFPSGSLQLTSAMTWKNGVVRLLYGRNEEGGQDQATELMEGGQP